MVALRGAASRVAKQAHADRVGRTTIVKVTVSGNDLPEVQGVIGSAMTSGVLGQQLTGSIEEATGIKSHIVGLMAGVQHVEQWNASNCQAHMATVVGRFSVTYTRRMVPMAIFNECTNFMPRISFSSDAMATALDVQKCREATAKFAKHWNYAESAAPHDFRTYCADVCEYKYGIDAPRCRASKGIQPSV